jgi:AraC family transcriptional regulator, L-rhamnose operon regulatory protein RhaS
MVTFYTRMRRYLIHDTFNIYEFSATTWEHPIHKHTYMEIIFILEGRGKHQLNGRTYEYRAGDIFYLGPEDFHSFDIVKETRFCYIRFSETFLRFEGTDAGKDWRAIVKTFLASSGQKVASDKREKSRLWDLFNILRNEYHHRHERFYPIIRDNIMRAIVTIISRNVSRPTVRLSKSRSSSLEDIILYIRDSIHQPELLRMDRLCDKFNYAPNYLSIFFKKQTGEPIKQFITRHRLSMVEGSLLYGKESIAHIADAYGFADESHLCKQFRRHYGMSPGEFRRDGKPNAR